MKRKAPALAGAACALVIVGTAAWLAAWHARTYGATQNVRHLDDTMRGGEASVIEGQATVEGATLVLGGTGDARATWVVSAKRYGVAAGDARDLVLDVVVAGGDLRAAAPGAAAVISLNGLALRRIPLARRGPEGYAPSVPFDRVPVVPLYVIDALTARAPPAASSGAAPLRVTVSLTGGARWHIDRVDVRASWTAVPRGGTGVSRSLIAAMVVLAALTVAISLAAARLYPILGIFGCAGYAALGVAMLVTRDQWFFRYWEALFDSVAYGAGSPAYQWSLTPLWAYVPGLVAPPAVAWCSATGDCAAAIDTLCIKLMMVACIGASAAILASLDERGAKAVAAGVLFSFATVMGALIGARDVVACAALAWGLWLSWHGRNLPAAVVMAAAVSIDEYLLPFALVPAAVEGLCGGTGGGTGVSRSHTKLAKPVLVLLIPPALIAAQWLALDRGYAASQLVSRLDYRYGEATWQQVLLSLNALPAVFVGHERAVFIGIYALFAVAGAALVVGSASAGRSSAPSAVRRVMPAAVLVTIGFFLSYSHVTQQEWYGMAVVLFAAAVVGALPVQAAFAFALAAGLKMYAHIGFREAVEPAFIAPADVGMLHIQTGVDRALLVVVLLILIAIAMCIVARRVDVLAGRWTPYAAAAFVLACLLTAQIVWPDWAILAALTLMNVAGPARAQPPEMVPPLDQQRPSRYLGLLDAVLLGGGLLVLMWASA